MTQFFLAPESHAPAAGQHGTLAELTTLTTTPSTGNRATRPTGHENNQRLPSETTVCGSKSTSRHLYWTYDDGVPVASTSQGDLRRLVNAPMDENRLRLALCTNLPGFLRRKSFWQGIQSTQAGQGITVSGKTVNVHERPSAQAQSPANLDEAAEHVEELLHNAIATRAETYGTVSTDLSGGMDSSSLAFVLDSLQEQTIFYHAGTDDPHNRDTDHARKALRELNGTLTELDSLTSTATAFGELDASIRRVDDGPLAWAANARHLGTLLANASSRGVRAHLTGIGGDELFDPLPATALGLMSTPSWKAGIRMLHRMGRMQRWSSIDLIRATVKKSDFATEMMRRVTTGDSSIVGPAEAFSWAPGFGISKFATKTAREAITECVQDELRQGAAPHHEDRVKHQMAEALIFQGEIVRQANNAYAHLGVSWEAPFLDDELTTYVLGLPADILVGAKESKPLLARATRGTVPRWLFTRSDKGEYSSDLFTEYKARRNTLRELFNDSYLVDMGHIDPDLVRDALGMPVVGTDGLFEIEQLASVERWVQSVR